MQRGGPLNSRNFRLLSACAVISVGGSQIATVAMPFAVLRSGGSASDVGYVAAAELTAMIGTLLLGGTIADRAPRHRGSEDYRVVGASNDVRASGFAPQTARRFARRSPGGSFFDVRSLRRWKLWRVGDEVLQLRCARKRFALHLTTPLEAGT